MHPYRRLRMVMASAPSTFACAACGVLHQKCTAQCLFALYFLPNQPQKFAHIHKHVLTSEPVLLQLAAQQMKRIASDSQCSTQERFYMKGLRALVEGPDGPHKLLYMR